jgi:hypothetical protein
LGDEAQFAPATASQDPRVALELGDPLAAQLPHDVGNRSFSPPSR